MSSKVTLIVAVCCTVVAVGMVLLSTFAEKDIAIKWFFTLVWILDAAIWWRNYLRKTQKAEG